MKRWNSKKIAFIAILIATSIAFVVIGAQAAAISSLPSLKLSLAGLPVKITGYLFGPLIGFAIGFITDIMTFLFVPIFYNPIYSVVLAITGLIPGIFAWFYFIKFNPLFTNKN
ncbi:MAG: ECF transporter S component, partial [Metamycoplasmataceae bacterium]